MKICEHIMYMLHKVLSLEVQERERRVLQCIEIGTSSKREDLPTAELESYHGEQMGTIIQCIDI